ncbi:GDP-mannose 4,6-dehydratase [Mycobacterium frederiksbergense]|uniref:GDP-mannose 4,6-dehydratase n=1 Tax=Mycolicibacterium frederiksbergense TaxID=117567 RepID=UPI0021F307AF|nr:GDP-mannose 4,6-dehydratase [Mycolicibacterium frederiksbergense]MCV7047098.1 GDP-mannose 4,6-dehydratase [Mycolicibacterium frederiksbergense]
MRSSSPEKPTALITGVTGQDGYYLSRLLVESGLTVHGIVGRNETAESVEVEGVNAHAIDLMDADAVLDLVTEVSPDYVFHLAGVSSVAMSWQMPVYASQVNAVSTAAVLDACLQAQERTRRKINVVNASSAEIFAGSSVQRQNEQTPIRPTSPYGASKAFGHMMCHLYRERGLHASNAILFNHESPRRPTTFVTRKITAAVAAIARGEQDCVTLGNVAVQRDWGWAPDYVDAMYRMAQRGEGDDFVLATGVAHSITDFVAAAFAAVDIPDWKEKVRIDNDLVRPLDSEVMVGDPNKAQRVLGWRPTMSFRQIVAAMVESDLAQEQDS